MSLVDFSVPLAEPPAYVTSAIFGRVFAVRWHAFSLNALAEVRREVAVAHHTAGRPLAYLSLIPSSPRDFSDGERQALAAYVRDLLAGDCVSLHHVIEGAGFAASARRSIVTGLALAASRPEAFHTYATLQAAIDAIALEIGERPADLLDETRRRGISFE